MSQISLGNENFFTSATNKQGKGLTAEKGLTKTHQTTNLTNTSPFLTYSVTRAISRASHLLHMSKGANCRHSLPQPVLRVAPESRKTRVEKKTSHHVGCKAVKSKREPSDSSLRQTQRREFLHAVRTETRLSLSLSSSLLQLSSR